MTRVATQGHRSAAAAALLGAALIAGVDEIVFHQLLAWHHFYDRTTLTAGLVSDGLLHAAQLVALVAGFLLLARLWRRGALVPARAWAGLFLGMGAFQLFDGLVVHKVLRLHQVREGVPTLAYDLAWDGAAVLLLAAGAVLDLRARRRVTTG